MRHVLCLALMLGCSERAAPPPSTPAATPAPTLAPVAPVEANRWRRARPREPDPEAKALYRRGVNLTMQGQRDQARALFDQIAERYPESRFAHRLRTGGSTAAVAALVGLIGVAAVPLLREVTQPDAPGPVDP